MSVGTKSFAHIMVGKGQQWRDHRAGAVWLEAGVLYKLGLMSEKTEGRHVRRPHGARPCGKPFTCPLPSSSSFSSWSSPAFGKQLGTMGAWRC